MRKILFSCLLLAWMLSCQEEYSSLEAQVTDVKLYTNSNHYSLPYVAFSIVINNHGTRVDTLYVNNYGREPLVNSGAYWVYYNNERDSMQLFSASCMNCYERTVLKPKDSLNLILQTHYLDMAKKSEVMGNIKSVDNEILEIFENWSVVKYLDSMNSKLLEVRRRN